MAAAYDRFAELRAFDATREGVKGLIDAGITEIPRFFVHPREDHPYDPRALPAGRLEIPLIDLGSATADAARRRGVVDAVRRAAETWGFFQVENHGVSGELLEEALRAGRRFFEQGGEDKARYYSRDPARKVRYQSNHHLYRSPAADWRDTLCCSMAPVAPAAEELPAACRDAAVAYSEHMGRLGRLLFELLSEALGLDAGRLNDMGCAAGHIMLFHYYPACPQPELAMGTTRHSDPDFLTILLQDQVGGLQVLHGDRWVDVSPVAGALVVNVGDLLQLISNDKLVSVEHRVVAKKVGPRTSVACFFISQGQPSSRLYGPIKELHSPASPAAYRETTVGDFAHYFDTKGLDGRSALSHYKL